MHATDVRLTLTSEAPAPAGILLHCGRDSFRHVRTLVDTWAPRRILVVASPGGLRRTRLLSQLTGYDTQVFSDFTPNPVLGDVLQGCRLRDAYRPDLVIGIGGGSALDTAKAIRVLPASTASARATLLSRRDPERPQARLLLIPTTAGTGSEVTQFSTLYVDGIKHSLDHPDVRAQATIVDPELAVSCPWRTTASCAFDALSHSLESYWSMRSTAQSRALAGRAARGIADLMRTVRGTLTPSAQESLSSLATAAGLAIDLTRTTAGHAFAYPLTARFGVPHGLACLLSLSWIFPLAAAQAKSGVCVDPRGAAFVQDRLSGMASFLGVAEPGGLGPALRELIRDAGFPDRLRDYGVTHGDVHDLVREGLGSSRSAQTPVAIGKAAALRSLASRI